MADDRQESVAVIDRSRRIASPPNLNQLAAAHVRQEIFSGQLKPGQKIDQDGIAALLGVSKLPVREALISLEHEGIVENVPRRGSFVAALTRVDILDHYQLIALASGLAARRAAEDLSADQLDRLSAILEEFEQAKSADRQDELNGAFHRTINLAGGSLRLRSALRLLTQTMPEHFYAFAVGWNESAKQEHRAVLAALCARDGAAAEKTMVDHITSGGQYAVERLEDVGFWG
jgi:DNA-binding GntR family transcriptional regulator